MKNTTFPGGFYVSSTDPETEITSAKELHRIWRGSPTTNDVICEYMPMYSTRPFLNAPDNHAHISAWHPNASQNS